jgi:hypothetical protein
MQATWEPYECHGRLTERTDLPATAFAFPTHCKEPLTDAKHVRNAVARFDQVLDVPDADRALAFANIEKAAQYYGVDLSETNWHQVAFIHNRTAKRARERARKRVCVPERPRKLHSKARLRENASVSLRKQRRRLRPPAATAGKNAGATDITDGSGSSA